MVEAPNEYANSGSLNTEQMITGIAAVDGCDRSRCSSSHPSISGIITSRMMASALASASLIWALAIPIHATLIPVFHFLGSLGLRNNYFGLICVYTAFWLPFTITIMVAYFESFPRELEEAGRIDGCTDLGAFWHIVLPVSRGALASIAIINVVGIWSELLFAYVLMNKPEVRTLPVGIVSFRGQYEVAWNMIFAGLSIATIPTLLFFLVFQRQITKGMTMGAIK